MAEAGIDLKHAEAQRGGDAEDRAEHREDVDRVPDRTVDPVADERVQSRADRERQPAAEGEIGERQPDDDVDRPGMHAPVEEGQHHRALRGLDGLALADGGRGVVLERFGHAEEDQADAHAGAEQHGEPRQVAVVGFAVVRSQPHVAVATQHQENREAEKARDGGDVEPAELAHELRLDSIEDRLGLHRKQGGEAGEGERQPGGGEEDGWIDLHPRASSAPAFRFGEIVHAGPAFLPVFERSGCGGCRRATTPKRRAASGPVRHPSLC